MELSQPKSLNPKTHVLLVAAVLLIINTALSGLTPESSINQQIFTLLLAIGFNVLTVFWCFYDSRERGKELSRYFILSVVIFGVLALFYYFFQTRGFKLGLILTAKFITLFLGVIIISAVVFDILNSIFK
jgi:RsiW-degrading membrane proteinase PrsW (M82 family)